MQDHTPHDHPAMLPPEPVAELRRLTHELLNELAQVVGYLELARVAPAQAVGAEYVGRAATAADAATVAARRAQAILHGGV